jgi:CYTH domain-containing protein
MTVVFERTAGEGRYAQIEREQRWLLAARPDGVDRPVTITDLYIPGTRLRVRKMESGSEVLYKLGQKVRPRLDRPETVKLTNMYLSEEEYATLSVLGSNGIAKTRWRWRPADRSMAVDEFHGPLAGLVLAEMELEPGTARLTGPPEVVADVTDDDRFSGGRLSQTTTDVLMVLLAEHGVDPAV